MKVLKIWSVLKVHSLSLSTSHFFRIFLFKFIYLLRNKEIRVFNKVCQKYCNIFFTKSLIKMKQKLNVSILLPGIFNLGVEPDLKILHFLWLESIERVNQVLVVQKVTFLGKSFYPNNDVFEHILFNLASLSEKSR